MADLPVSTVKAPEDVTPVFTAIVIVPDAVFTTLKSKPMFTFAGMPENPASMSVPVGRVRV